MDRFWLLTWTNYGTWLPGDARGFVSNVAGEDGHGIRFNEPGIECVSSIPPLHRYMNGQLKCPPIWFTQDHADLLLPQFRETASYRGWTLFAVAVMANHTHIVVAVPGDPDPSDILGDFKSYGSRQLNRRWGKPASGTWWTEGGSKRKKADEAAIWNAIAYVRDQPRPLLVWLNAGAIISYFGGRGHELLASGGRQPPVSSPQSDANNPNRGQETQQGADAPRSPSESREGRA